MWVHCVSFIVNKKRKNYALRNKTKEYQKEDMRTKENNVADSLAKTLGLWNKLSWFFNSKFEVKKDFKKI